MRIRINNDTHNYTSNWSMPFVVATNSSITTMAGGGDTVDGITI